jgi:hypothetical protein
MSVIKQWSDVKWCKSDALVERTSSLKIGSGEGTKTGVLSRDTNGLYYKDIMIVIDTASVVSK